MSRNNTQSKKEFARGIRSVKPDTPDDRPDDLIAPGSTLDDMVVAHRVAHGMNTDVLAVWHRELRTPLICKVLRLDTFSADDPHAGARARKWRRLLRLEAAALRRFHHPGIVRLISDHTGDIVPYLLLEHVGGRTLRDRLRAEKQLPIDEAVRIVQHVGAALTHVHHHGFIHRDLKPSNIILRDGRPVLLDFGVVWRWRTTITNSTNRANTNANLSTAQTSTRRPPDRCGTPQYLAPEQVRRAPLSPLTDVYGLGVLLYELIAGTRPFPASKRTHEHIALETRYPQLTLTPPPLRDSRPEAPVKLASVIRRAMHREPDQRFPNVEELLVALDPFTDTKIYPQLTRVKAGDAFIPHLKPRI